MGAPKELFSHRISLGLVRVIVLVLLGTQCQPPAQFAARAGAGDIHRLNTGGQTGMGQMILQGGSD